MNDIQYDRSKLFLTLLINTCSDNAVVFYILQNVRMKLWDNSVLLITFAVTQMYLLFYLPFLVVLWKAIVTQEIPKHPTTNFVTLWLAGANSVFNPIVYFITVRPFREEVNDMFVRKLQIKAGKEVINLGHDSRASTLDYSEFL